MKNKTDMKWKKTDPANTLHHMYELIGEPYVIHIIKTGWKDKFFVVYDDAHQFKTGDIETLTAAEIQEKFGIDVNTDFNIKAFSETDSPTA